MSTPTPTSTTPTTTQKDSGTSPAPANSVQPTNPIPSPKKTNVLFVIPCTSNQLGVGFTNCIMDTKDLLIKEGINCTVNFVKNSMSNTELKNQTVSYFVKNTKFDYLFFINPRLSWLPSHALQMIKKATSDTILGAACPKDVVLWKNIVSNNVHEKTKKFFDNIADSEQSKLQSELNTLVDYYRANTLLYNIELNPDNTNIVDGLLNVKYMSSDFMLIGRNVVNELIKAFPDNRYNVGTGDNTSVVYNLFQSGTTNFNEKRVFLSDDMVFCYRYLSIKVDGLKLLLFMPITRTDYFDYGGNYFLTTKIKSNKPKQTKPDVISNTTLIKPSNKKINDTPTQPTQSTETTPTPLISLVKRGADDKKLMNSKLSEEEKTEEK